MVEKPTLTPKQARFVQEYLVDLNAAQAAIRAGYSAKTAETCGPRLLRNARVRAAVEAGQAKVHAKLEISAGRVLQELARVSSLDECHVITHHAGTADVVEAIKSGLEQDGLGDLVLEVASGDASGASKVTRHINRRPDFAKTEIYLPKIMITEGGEVRDLDYETDVLSSIDWRGFDPQAIAARIPENARGAENRLQRIGLSESGDELFVGETVAANTEILAFDPAYAVRMISDIVPNPFVGREVVGSLIWTLKARGFDDDKLGILAGLIVDELRKGLDAERATKAEAIFKAEVTAGRIQFRLRVDGHNWRMPSTVETIEPENGRKLVGATGNALERSLFAPIYENEMNTDERDVAVHLDGEKAVTWWHRNVARQQYGIQGWRKAKIYPDFIFAVRHEGENTKITVLETKGDQLDNLDTAYKRDVLNFLSDKFRWDDYTPAGELELVKNTGETVHCTLILMSEWQTKLAAYL